MGLRCKVSSPHVAVGVQVDSVFTVSMSERLDHPIIDHPGGTRPAGVTARLVTILPNPLRRL